jgi:hypothetical protein
MNVALLLPLLAFLTGLMLATTPVATQLKTVLSSLLARCFIPIVIIYNMVFYQAGSLSLMLFSFVVAILLFYGFLYFSNNKLSALCFSYVNMAWLGFPFAIALFGAKISPAMVALYIGGSIFGNLWAVTAVSDVPQPFSSIVKKVAYSPPIIALSLAALFWLFGIQHWLEQHGIDWIYAAAKLGMSFSGMCILGMWLRYTKVQASDLWQSSQMAVLKLLCGLVLCGLTYRFIPIPQIEQSIGVMFLLFCLPPAANIVALETHYQGTGTSAKSIASGTMVSCVVVSLYGFMLHLMS